MPSTFLEIANNVANITGIRSLGTLVGNPEPHAMAMLALLNRGGRILSRERNSYGQGWTVLTKEHTINTVNGQEEYLFPTDFQALVDGTVWSRSEYLAARGPLSPHQWQRQRSGLVGTVQLVPNYRLRRSSSGLGRSFFLDPVPDGGEELVIEYTSTSWIVASDDVTFRERIEVDTDRPILSDELVELDLEWRYRNARGLDYAAALAEFEYERDKHIADDPGISTISLGQDVSTSQDPYYTNVPESGYGGIGS